MSTRKQIEANRRNAKQSTGPRTPEGKARSAGNATTHGLTAQRSPLLAEEDPKEYEAHRIEVHQDLQPGSRCEKLIVDRIVAVQWRLQRVPALEAALFAELRVGDLGQPGSTAAAWLRDGSAHGGALSRLSRYEGQLERSLLRLHAELRRLQAERARAERALAEDWQQRRESRTYAEVQAGKPSLALSDPIPARALLAGMRPSSVRSASHSDARVPPPQVLGRGPGGGV